MAGAGPMLLNQFAKLFASRLAYLTELIGPDKWTDADEIWKRFYNEKTSSKMREDFLMWGGFGPFATMAENDAVTYDSMLQGPSLSVTHTLYGLGFQIGFLVGQWDMDGIISRCAPELARSMRNSIQILAAAPWNGAFATTKTADGLYLCSASHTYIRGGGTWSNLGTGDITQTSMELALRAFMNLKNPMGQYIAMEPKYLICTPGDYHQAVKVMGTPKAMATSNNDISAVYNSLEIVVWPHLTDGYWFVVADKGQTSMDWFWAIRPQTSSGFDFDKEAAKTKTLFACSQGVADPRGIYGSAG
jgi:hypothetical protein